MILAYYVVFPGKVPYKRYIVITAQPPKKVNFDDPFEFRFTFPDKFYNLCEERNYCVEKSYLSIIGYQEHLPVINLFII